LKHTLAQIKGNRCALFRFRNNEQDEKVVEVIKAKNGGRL